MTRARLPAIFVAKKVITLWPGPKSEKIQKTSFGFSNLLIHD